MEDKDPETPASDELVAKGKSNRIHRVFLDHTDPDAAYDDLTAMVERSKRIEDEERDQSAR